MDRLPEYDEGFDSAESFERYDSDTDANASDPSEDDEWYTHLYD